MQEFVPSVTLCEIQSVRMRIVFYSQLTTVGEVLLNLRCQKVYVLKEKDLEPYQVFFVLMSYNFFCQTIYVFLCNNRGGIIEGEKEHMLQKQSTYSILQ